MTRDDIIRMAREAGMERVVEVCIDGTQTVEFFFPELLERFAALVAEATLEKNNLTWVANCQHLVKAEREACADLVEKMGMEGYGTLGIAAMIGARGVNSGE